MTERIQFTHLYGTTFAAFRGKRQRFRMRKVIFPDGFTPRENTEYEVNIHQTKTGTFRYEEEDFIVCRASMATAASSLDIIVHKASHAAPLNSMATAFDQFAFLGK